MVASTNVNNRQSITIITATLDRPSLKEACESVDSQTFTNWQHFVLGDGILPHDYCHPNRTTIGFSQPLGARQRARNMPDGTPNPILAWALCNLSLGDYVSFLDDDNTYHNDFLEKMFIKLSSTPSCGIVLCEVENQRGDWQPIDGYPEYRRCDNSGFLVRGDVAKDIGYPPADPTKECVQDYEFIKACADKYGWTRIPEKLVTFGVAPNPPPKRNGLKIFDSWSEPIKAVLKIRDGDYIDGINDLISVCDKDLHDAWSLWNLGEGYIMSNQGDQAKNAWRKWRTLVTPVEEISHHWIYYCYALSSFYLEQERAIHYANKAIMHLNEFCPNEELLYNEKLLNLGLYYFLIGDVQKARANYILAFNRSPDEYLLRDAIWNLSLLKKMNIMNNEEINITIDMLVGLLGGNIPC